ncbi:MAG: hypothetical protein MZV70_11365 [Desulfobacterales bacterium]|nr:hypothetical protein [Desulfobacterales bacterium]
MIKEQKSFFTQASGEIEENPGQHGSGKNSIDSDDIDFSKKDGNAIKRILFQV